MDMEQIRQFFIANDTFARYLGIELQELAPGYARAVMPIKHELTNGVNIAHGGAIFSLADLVLGAAANSHGQLALAISSSISYIKAGRGAYLTAEATEISLGPKLATYAIEVKDDFGEVIAFLQGTVYRKNRPILDSV